MLKGLGIVLMLTFGASGLVGCSDAKEKKCKEAFAAVKGLMSMGAEMAKKMGGGADVDKEMAGKVPSEAQFLGGCKQLPNEAIDCMDMKYVMSNMEKCGKIMQDPKLKEIMKGAMGK